VIYIKLETLKEILDYIDDILGENYRDSINMEVERLIHEAEKSIFKKFKRCENGK
jgi:hypothetical protein